MNDPRIEDFWKHKKTSLHRFNSSTFFKKKAEEHYACIHDFDLNGNFIDLGCGAGEILKELSQKINISLAQDQSESMLEVTRNCLANTSSITLTNDDIFVLLPKRKESAWMSSQGVNQYLNQQQMIRLLNCFVDNKHCRSLYFFDCINPLWFTLYPYGSSFLNKHPGEKKCAQPIFVALKGSVKCLLFFLKNIKTNYHKLAPEMGYGIMPTFWHNLDILKNYKITMYGSKFYEYRYHVVITKHIIEEF